ncbi:MAG: single-stranded DNA-binding protein [Candidatus Viridilinea halotolerans]|uniref:Single-stranded DNA-binding protein n=1 Tax=Candidatus Viridilinea halotolerans TaxID=2491704 RepID=A0A426TUM0_9CHLR|nr:MAG: single-stranded DNA-binding protein [Candidatus Viridilinea halotolerans]
MAKDLNKVQFTGHLGADPEMRYTPQGSAVTNFRVASNRAWKDRDGGAHEDTEWFRVVAWERLGEICNQYLTKGMRVYIEGRLQTRRWMDRDNVERFMTEVVAQDMIILSSKNERGNPPAYDASEAEASDGPAVPTRRAASSNGGAREPAPARVPAHPPTRNQPQEIENDDDIPF